MAKKSKEDRNFNLILGAALIVIALIGIEKIITLLLVILGVYFLYQGIKK